ncbi:ATP-binding protein [Paenibacillus flagellatus]|uniref:histidine kinase n=1 Tax=Paenibacillus flagellatus TaxID=2211139 RepID=A0A2V5K590_9BACL|nr:ATP-binding protein [Paenibacillus flagellatus]PYI53104.1 PhoR protein [Paenibacillus flagellatus]
MIIRTNSVAMKVSRWIGAVVLAFALLVTAAGLYVNRHISDGREKLERNVADQQLVQTLYAESQSVVSDLRAYLAFGRDEFLTQFMEKRKRLDAGLAEAAGHFDSRGYGETFADEWNAIRRSWSSYVQTSDTVIDLKKRGDMDEIANMSRTSTTSSVNDMAQHFGSILAGQSEAVDRLLEDNRKRTESLVWLSVLVVAGAAMMGWMLVRYLRRTVLAPVVEADTAVNRIAGGEYVEVTPSGRNDELGRLMRGIHFMSNELKRRHVALQETNKELTMQRDLLEAQNEEITAQQLEQQEMLLKLTDRERELELINTYQEKLTGFVEMKSFLHHSIAALLQALRQDAAVLVAPNPETGAYDVVYSYGYPPGALPSSYGELFGPGRRVLDEKQPIYRKRTLASDERGIHGGYDTALDQYYPLLDEHSQVIGLLLLTAYGACDTNDALLRQTKGLVRQFALAYLAQTTNEERRRQAYLLEELNEELSQERDGLQQQRDLVRRIIESIHEGMIMCDAAGRIVFSNRRMDELFGFDRFAASNIRDFCRHLEEFCPHKSQLCDFTEAVMSGSLDQLQERFTHVREDGREDHFELYVSSIADPIDNTRSFLFVFRDRTNEELADEAKNEFISIVSHELRTPLASVLGFMEILLNRDVPKEKQHKYMETIYKEANRLSNLINDFLDLQRMESGKQSYHMVPTDVSALVHDVAEQWHGKQGHRIELEAEPGLLVTADVDRLTQVMHNLISNAVKYSPGADKVAVSVRREGEDAVIEVRDSGLGIPDDAKEKLFNKFYRVDNSDRRQIGGTGLGLAIVKEIVDSHRGTLSFDSELGRGSTFRVRLKTYRVSGLGGKVVVLEDDDNLSKLIAVAFEKLQVPTVQIRSAEDAILSLREPGNRPPLLCIVDIQLEGAKSGWDFIAELLARPDCSHTPVIVSTVLEPPKHFLETDTEKYLRKPFTVDRLLELASGMLESRPDRSPPVVFPVQDEAAIASTLLEKGIRVADLKIKKDIIEVEVKKDD